MECHAGDSPEGSFAVSLKNPDWKLSSERRHWERVFEALDTGQMPPSEAEQPAVKDRAAVTTWLQTRLDQHATPGDGIPRRLNREEYENSIRQLFGYPEFSIPDSFPSDDVAEGFDNVAEGLILSPPLMAQYLATATRIADEILPPDRGDQTIEQKRYQVTPNDLVNYRDAGVAKWDGVYRMVSSKNMANSAAWPTRFEAPQSGRYRISVTLKAFQTDSMFYEKRIEPFKVTIHARPKTEQTYAPMNELRRLAQLNLSPETEQTLVAEVELYQGEIFGVRWADGPCQSTVPSREYCKQFFDERLSKNKPHYAAMLKLGPGTRGMTQEEFYLATRDIMQSDDLDLDDPRLEKLPEEYGGGFAEKPFRWIKNYVHEEMFRAGPAVDVLHVAIEGPLVLIEDDTSRRRAARTRTFVGRRDNVSSSQAVRSTLKRFLPRAFRRPVTADELNSYVAAASSELAANPHARLEDALHLAVRKALVSPHFLYRSAGNGRLDSFELANRLSYFLTIAPPDKQLLEQAQSGELLKPNILAAEAIRLIDSAANERFVTSFTGQWLGTRKLQDIMPDPRLLKFFDPDRLAIVKETELFFAEMLRENRPLQDFIDPGFSYRNGNLNKIYGGTLQGPEIQRVTFERGGRDGGLLTWRQS